MPYDYQTSSLWRRTLGSTDFGENQPTVNRLREAYFDFRSNAKLLAEDIKISMPMFTDHGIEHIDSLWDMASMIVDDDFPLNPAEAFILGGAFLLHDLGMGLNSYPGGKDAVEADPTFARVLESGVTDPPTAAEDASNRELALVTTLRLRHAEQAARLVDQEFETDSGRKVTLLAQEDLRRFFGDDIGRIAQSHWVSVDELPSFVADKHGTDGSLPGEWNIDPLKLACILRLADASHIDSRRAPLMLHAFRPQVGVSRDHWVFQQRLNRPIVNKSRLEYTSSRSFPESESRAWWLAYDTLKMIDFELKQVDAVCRDLGRKPFKVNSVAGVSTPERLASLVKTQGWTPIDATLKVSKVNTVVETLGGAQLYGDNPTIPLRELIANAADASHLYAAHSQRDVPAVSIRLYQHGGSDWLEVEDHGIGMTQHQMAESLLDFGRSQWKATTNSDLADLPAASFRPRGKFGIGFFSAFMIADRVEIKSLRYRQGSSETAMLVFEDGLAGRPLFRNVPVREELTQNGTLVRLRLKNPPLSEKGLLETDAIEQSVSQMVRDMLINMCALLDVDLKFEGPDDRDAKRLIEANEWSTLPADQLFDRIYTFDMKNPNYQKMYIEWRKYFIENEQSLFDEDGRVIGRAVLASGLENESTADVWWWPAPDAKTYVGGLLSDYVYNCLGAFSGAPLKADRNSSFPLANPSELQRWASTQIDLMDRKRFASSSTRYGAADLGRSVGVSLPSMPCGILRSGEISPDQLGDWLSTRNEVVIIPDWEINTYHSDSGSLVFRERQQGRQLDLPDNAIVIRLGSRNFFPEEIQKTAKDSRFGDFGDLRLREWNPRNWWYQYGKSGSTALLLEHVLQQWGVTPHQVAEHFEQLALVSDKDTRAPIKLFESDQTVLIEGFRLRRPTEQSE